MQGIQQKLDAIDREISKTEAAIEHIKKWRENDKDWAKKSSYGGYAKQKRLGLYLDSLIAERNKVLQGGELGPGIFVDD